MRQSASDSEIPMRVSEILGYVIGARNGKKGILLLLGVPYSRNPHIKDFRSTPRVMKLLAACTKCRGSHAAAFSGQLLSLKSLGFRV